MSVINNALTDIANKNSQGRQKIEKAEFAQVKTGNKLAWAVGGFCLSLAIGGWAVSVQQPTSVPVAISEESVTVVNTVPEQVVAAEEKIQPSPTAKVVASSEVEIYQESVEPKGISKKKTEKAATSSVTTVKQPVLLAKADKPETQHSSKQPEVSKGSLAVKQVELTPEQLSDTAIERGKKALDANDLKTAIQEFESALRYQPENDDSRKRLAALYYGKEDVRNAIEVLQQGIRLNESGQELRIALAKLLIRENQPEAALSPLLYLPDNAKNSYLELRAALAQQVKNNPVAAETYQILTERAPDNARWWLGLAIQQERNSEFNSAFGSYQQAISKVGVSKQTQAFIRDRLKLLESLQGEKSAD